MPTSYVLVLRNAKTILHQQEWSCRDLLALSKPLLKWPFPRTSPACTHHHKPAAAGFLPTWGFLCLKVLSWPLRTNAHSFCMTGTRHLILSLLIFYLEANMWGADTMDTTILMFISWGKTKLSPLNYYLKVPYYHRHALEREEKKRIIEKFRSSWPFL